MKKFGLQSVFLAPPKLFLNFPEPVRKILWGGYRTS